MIGYTAACLGSIIYGLSSASNATGSSGMIGFCVQPVTRYSHRLNVLFVSRVSALANS